MHTAVKIFCRIYKTLANSRVLLHYHLVWNNLKRIPSSEPYRFHAPFSAVGRAVFPLGRFFSASQRFVGARANNFSQYGKHSFRKLNKLVEIWHLVHFNTRLVWKLGHKNVFPELGVQLFHEHLSTRQLAIKLEGTQRQSSGDLKSTKPISTPKHTLEKYCQTSLCFKFLLPLISVIS